MVRRRGILVLAATSLAAMSLSAARHPTHTSSAELECAGETLRVTLRIFADDASATGSIRAHVKDRFHIVDRHGHTIALTWRGAEPAGDVVRVRLEGRAPSGLSGATVADQILTDRFADQVNVVRASCGRRTATLVFTRGDGPKALP
jgi:hypothetical protein